MTASHVVGTADVTYIEAPVTTRAYLLCGFAALGGILFGFDSAYVSGILDMPFLIHLYTIIMGSIIYMIGVVLQVASSTLVVMVTGRLIANLSVGFVSAIIILYMSEVVPEKSGLAS